MKYLGIEITDAMVAAKIVELRASHDEMLAYGGKIAVQGIVEDLWWENASEQDRADRQKFIEADFAIDGGEWSAAAYLVHERKVADDLYRTFSDVWGNPAYFLAKAMAS